MRYVATENPVTLGAFLLFGFFVLLALFGPWLAPYDPLKSNTAMALKPPSAAHWFGTDALGRDILFVPQAEVVHLRGASGRQRPAATERAYRRSQLAFYEKHHPRWAPLLRAYLRLRGLLPKP